MKTITPLVNQITSNPINLEENNQELKLFKLSIGLLALSCTLMFVLYLLRRQDDNSIAD